MATELGTAYITVMPSMKGFTKGITSELGGSGTESGKAFGTAFQVAAGSLIAKAVEGIAQTAADTFMRGFEGFMNYEQLAGGVEKIFDQADIGRILSDAQYAYKDLNMSANEYLESINSVGATFAQTMGDQRGYDVAREGMLAISDYASGTGKNIELLNEKYQLITRSASSYQSIADQFAGILPQTSSDFLEQATAAGYLTEGYEKLTDVPVAEYQEAVTKMLQKGVSDMGLAGNTLAESTETISGSLAMLKGSWDNFLTGLFDESADMGVLGENLIKSVGAVLKNVVPRIGSAIGRAILGLPGAIATALSQLPPMLEPTIVAVFGEGMGGKIVDALRSGVEGLLSAFDGVVSAVSDLIGFLEPLAPVIAAIAAAIAGVAAYGWVAGAIASIGSAIMGVVSAIGSVVAAISGAGGIGAALTALAGGPVGVVIGAIAALVAGITVLWNTNEDFRNFVTGCWEGIQAAIGDAMAAVGSAIEEVRPIAEKVFGAISQAVSTAVGVIMEVWGQLQPYVEAIFSGIAEAIGGYWQTIRGIFETVGGIIVGIVTGDFSMVQEGIDNVMNGISTVISGVWNAIMAFLSMVLGKLSELVKGAFETIRTTIGNVLNGIRTTVTNVWNGILSVITNVLNNMRNAVSNAVKTISNTVSSVFNGIKSTVSSIWNGIKTAITNPIETAKNTVKGIIDTIRGFFNFSISWPHIPLPYFSISPAGWQVGDLLKGSIPSLDISWHAKGGIVNGAQLIGVGERGRELVVPTENDRYMEPFARATARNMGMGDVVAAIERLERDIGPIIARYAPEMSARDRTRMIRRAMA